jgi:hypothetical protein
VPFRAPARRTDGKHLAFRSAALANAVYHATGTRIRDLPITLDKLL